VHQEEPLMLGELYKPKGLAAEHVKFVLQEEDVWACNVAFGCTGRCGYCYNPLATHKGEAYFTVRQPSKPPAELVLRQLEKGLRPGGVFLSFSTDPCMNMAGAVDLCNLLVERGIKVATSTKFTCLPIEGIHHGITYITDDEDFHRIYELGTAPAHLRLNSLGMKEHTWASLEPFPVSDIFKVNVEATVEDLHFVDAIILGKWNYNPKASRPKAREEYAAIVPRFIDACNCYGIRWHVKRETIQFINGIKEASA
jgi:hypothetical protein